MIFIDSSLAQELDSVFEKYDRRSSVIPIAAAKARLGLSCYAFFKRCIFKLAEKYVGSFESINHRTKITLCKNVREGEKRHRLYFPPTKNFDLIEKLLM